MIRSRKRVFLVMAVALLAFAANLSLPAASHSQASQSADQTGTSTKSTTKKKTSDDTSTVPAPASDSANSKKSGNFSRPAENSAKPAAPVTAQQTPPAKSNAMVWVNTDSGVYHKPGSRYYGKTRQGKYMTEADAIKAGYRAAEKN